MTTREMIANYPAARNFEPEVFHDLERRGLIIVCAVFEGISAVRASKNRSSHIAPDLAAFLPEGSYHHSTFGLPEQRWFFYHVPKASLAQGIAGLKQGLQAKGLLRPAKILTGETPNQLLQWFPPTAEVITA